MYIKTRGNRHQITPERMSEFEQRPNEDTYQWIARQLTMAKPYEAAWLMMLRNDEKQRRVYEMLQLAKTERSNRHMKTAMFITVAISTLSLIID